MARSSAAVVFRTLCLFGALAAAHSQQVLAADADAGPVSSSAGSGSSGSDLETVEVQADKLHVLPTEPVDSVFGLGKTIIETPRSLTSISNEMLNRVNITDINDLVALSPGSFTQSFFGVAGSLDIRGTAGENYFRGVRRIDNPGNYPQVIGASDRIDIVRGPASPIYGPSKVGGYLNFVPKSARADSGAYLAEAKGEVGVTRGSWDKKTLHAELGGPSSLLGVPSGYYVYAEFEDSGSYYENSATRQALYQASYNIDFSSTLRTEMGGMYQDFDGNQVAGWNRLTQQLINNGTYITGSPANIDTNGNGRIDLAEAGAAGIGTDVNFIFNPPTQTPASMLAALQASPNLALVNPGTAHLSGNQVLVAPGDRLTSGVTTLYFDMIYTPSDAIKLTNKLFYEYLNNWNENAYGFSQLAHTWVIEDQLTLSYKTTVGTWLTANIQTGPQVRHQNFKTGDDFFGEFFDRRDLTQPSSPLDLRSLATRGQDPFADHAHGYYTDTGYALLTDLVFFDHLDLLTGGRFDNFKVRSQSYEDALITPGLLAEDTQRHTSWSASVSYQLPLGLRPYVTIARQSTLTAGEGGQVEPSLVATHAAVAGSKLNEYGIKGSWLDGQLYWAADYFKQERTDFNSQDETSNNSTLSKGYEFETRWVVNPFLTVTGAYTNLKVFDTTAQAQGGQFAFVGAGDLQGVDPALMYGGAVGALFLAPTEESSRKAGIPENLFSVYAMVNFEDLSAGPMSEVLRGLTGSIGVTHVQSTWSGFSKVVTLPSYTLLNAGLHYESAKWKLGIEGKNLTNERYFRSNFPDLFGSNVVLPELPRNWLLSVGYKF
jgi:iron complex outermembrane receptor protein